MEWIRQVLAVSGVLMLLGASLWWLRRKGLAQYGCDRQPAPESALWNRWSG